MSDTVISHTFTFLITNMLDNFYIYSDFSMRCIRLTTRGCRPYRLSLLGCRFGRSESSGFVGVFRLSSSSLIRLCTCIGVRNYWDWRRYRYTCRPAGLSARGNCRPKQIRFPLRGRLKLLRFSDGLNVLSGFY